MTEPSFPGNGWTPVQPPKVVNKFLFFLFMQLMLYLLKCLYLNPAFFLFYFSDSLPYSTRAEWASNCMGLGSWLELKHDSQLSSVLDWIIEHNNLIRKTKEDQDQFRFFSVLWVFWFRIFFKILNFVFGVWIISIALSPHQILFPRKINISI